MKLATKLKMYVAVAVVALAGIYAVNLNPNALSGPGGDNSFVVSVTWAPIHMVYRTRVVVEVDGVMLLSRNPAASPWGHTVVAARGATVRLTATNEYPNLQTFDCMIMKNNESVPRTGYMKITRPGQVICSA